MNKAASIDNNEKSIKAKNISVLLTVVYKVPILNIVFHKYIQMGGKVIFLVNDGHLFE